MTVSTKPSRIALPESDAAARFDALTRAHYAGLCNFAFRFVGSRDIAEDIVQDVLVGVWRRHQYFDYSDPLPYLYQSVRNQVVSYARKRTVRERWLQRVRREPQPVSETAAASAETSDLAQAIAVAIDALPERCRLIFTMSREQDLTYQEIAGILGISVKTVETQMSRALKTLRSGLAGYLPPLIALISL